MRAENGREAELLPAALVRGASTSVQGGAVTIHHPDGTVEVRTGGTLGWRNNNPGNIQAGAWARRHGAIGSDGVRAIFPDEATGEAALEAALNGPDYSSLTIDGVVEKRTPKDDPRNDTERTKALVRHFSGLPGNAIVNQLSPAEKQRLYAASRRSEGWGVGIVSQGRP